MFLSITTIKDYLYRGVSLLSNMDSSLVIFVGKNIVLIPAIDSEGLLAPIVEDGQGWQARLSE
jgi:hypothetical protein